MGAICTNNNLGGFNCTCGTGYTGTNCQYGSYLLNYKLITVIPCFRFRISAALINNILCLYSTIELLKISEHF